jgi:hypothetical protein
MGREIAKGEYFKLSDAVVGEHPAYVALVIPVNDILSGEIEG